MDTAQASWKDKLHEIIYEADTKAGKLFDVLLLVTIVASIILVMLESVPTIDAVYHNFFNIAEWVITLLFTIEYILRIICIKKPSSYIFSYFGLIDFLATIPKYLSLIMGGTHALLVLRALRLLRVFRILKISRYIGESNKLISALKASRPKITVFVFAVMILAIILGTVMYLVEGNADSGFTSIPRSIYWTIVTLTTVGYGDITPATALGQFIASIVMIMGYGIIAVPTGIVSAEFTAQNNTIANNTKACTNCGTGKHKDDAKFCNNCGDKL
ncbi:ion transporter [Flavicella sediminum]|uniref:ion transporter n=1 Tax=Flavicella sediminum TaxID=2585141 RepID=UPI00111C9E4C|nr:ion transporter [Flavicella sediminum]